MKDCSTSKLSGNYFRLIIIAICIEYSYYNTLMLNELMFTLRIWRFQSNVGFGCTAMYMDIIVRTEILKRMILRHNLTIRSRITKKDHSKTLLS